ncbi:MAG: hypothetical protein SF066_00825 [Thermoanaerobaculia bacterium]|nr:hypothetical protein [Thermoanaerobaculia bacterium]
MTADPGAEVPYFEMTTVKTEHLEEGLLSSQVLPKVFRFSPRKNCKIETLDLDLVEDDLTIKLDSSSSACAPLTVAYSLCTGTFSTKSYRSLPVDLTPQLVTGLSEFVLAATGVCRVRSEAVAPHALFERSELTQFRTTETLRGTCPPQLIFDWDPSAKVRFEGIGDEFVVLIYADSRGQFTFAEPVRPELGTVFQIHRLPLAESPKTEIEILEPGHLAYAKPLPDGLHSRQRVQSTFLGQERVISGDFVLLSDLRVWLSGLLESSSAQSGSLAPGDFPERSEDFDLELVVQARGGFVKDYALVEKSEPKVVLWPEWKWSRFESFGEAVVDLKLVEKLPGDLRGQVIVLQLAQDGARWIVKFSRLGPTPSGKWEAQQEASSSWASRRDRCSYSRLTASMREGSEVIVALEGDSSCTNTLRFDLSSGRVLENPRVEVDRKAALTALQEARRISPSPASGAYRLNSALESLTTALADEHALDRSTLADIHWLAFEFHWALHDLPGSSRNDRARHKTHACLELELAILAGRDDKNQWLHTVCGAVRRRFSRNPGA